MKNNKDYSIENEAVLKEDIAKCLLFASASAFVCITTMGIFYKKEHLII